MLSRNSRQCNKEAALPDTPSAREWERASSQKKNSLLTEAVLFCLPSEGVQKKKARLRGKRAFSFVSKIAFQIAFQHKLLPHGNKPLSSLPVQPVAKSVESLLRLLLRRGVQ